MEAASSTSNEPSTSGTVAADAIATEPHNNGVNGVESTNDESKAARNKKRKRPKKKVKQIPNTAEVAAATLVSVMEKEVMDSLLHCQPHRMMDLLNRAIRPDPGYLFHACMQVKDDLMGIFSRSFPVVRVDVFGSTIIGTAFKGNCDLQLNQI